jgi:hypothetical protein
MRRPAKLERAGALTPRDRIWAAIRAFGTGRSVWFSVAEIMTLSEQRVDTVLSYLTGLEKAGYIAYIAEARAPLLKRVLRCYQLVRDVGVEAPRVDADGKPVTQGIGDEQMWTAMRALKGTFGARELSIAASTERHVVAHNTAKRYARYLAYAGYLAVVKESTGGRGSERIYRFVKSRNTGPRAPIITRDKSVIDGNTGDIVLQGGKKS